MTREELNQIIDDLFETEALAIGGLVADHEIGDGATWRLMDELRLIRERVLDRLGEEKSTDDTHPAVERFLDDLRHGRDFLDSVLPT